MRDRYLRTYYEVAQICNSGHLINNHTKSHPESNQKLCSKCGQSTFSTCPVCNEPIRGCKHTEFEKFQSGNFLTGQVNMRTFTYCQEEPYEIPLYCQCGNPYPWQETIMRVTEDIINMADELDEMEKAIFKENFPQLLIDSPETITAALRISKVLKSANIITAQAFKSALASKLAGKALELLGWN